MNKAGQKMRNFILLSFIAFVTILVGCSDPSATTGSSAGAASASFAVQLPEPEAKAAYIDSRADYIEVRANETDIAGFDVEGVSAVEINLDWKQCYSQLYYETETEPDKAALREKCGPRPGSNEFPQVGERQVISRDNPVVNFDNLQAGETYRFTAVLYDGDPNEEGSRFLNWSTTFATLQAGDNPIELNMIQGTWEVANDSPVELQLLNRARSNINVTHNNEPFFETVDWYKDDANTVETPAILLGLAAAAGETISLERFHIKAYDYYLNDDGSGTPPQARMLQEQSGWGVVSGWPLGLMVPRKVLLETSSGKTLGEGFSEPDLSAIEGGSISMDYGMDAPAILMQQYDPSQTTPNRHSLSLGYWSVNQDNASNGFSAHAGLEFLNPLDRVYQELKTGGFNLEGPVDIEGLQVSRVSDNYSSYQTRPDLENVAYYSLQDQTSNFILSDGLADDFTGLLEAEALKIKDGGQTIEGTLLEYMGYEESSAASFTLPDLIESSDGGLEAATTQATAAVIGVPENQNNNLNPPLSLQERNQRFKAHIRHIAQMYWLSRQLGVTAAPVPACFVEEFSVDHLGSAWYQLNSEGVWEVGAAVYGEWYLNTETGEVIRDDQGEVIYYTYAQMGEPDWQAPADSEPVYGVVDVDTNTSQLPETYYQETRTGESEFCLQPITLKSGALNPPVNSGF
jgi:hypothetical protein